MENTCYEQNLNKLREYYNETDNLQLNRFIPDYISPSLSSPLRAEYREKAVKDIDQKITRDWLYHTSFMKIVDIVAQLGTCSRRKVGAVLVKNRRILTTGFNGTPPGSPHCSDEICPGRSAPSGSSLSLCAAVHAEENCLLYCAKYGVSATEAVLYCSCEPCDDCMKLVETVGITKVIFKAPYPTKMSALRKYFKAKGILMSDFAKEYSEFTMGRVSFSMEGEPITPCR